MLKKDTKSFLEIRTYLNDVPVINTHEHYSGKTEPIEDVLGFIIGNYYSSDLISAAYGNEKEVQSIMYDNSIPFDERYEVFEKFFVKSNKTAYAKYTWAGFQACWGVGELNKTTLLELQEKLQGRNQQFYEKLMSQYGIKAKIVDIITPDKLINIIDGKDKSYSAYCRFAFPLPAYHRLNSCHQVYNHGLPDYLDRKIVSLDDYVEAFENLLKKSVDFGVICLKDQSAYTRTLDYKNATKAEAEKVFNKLINNPRDTCSTEEGRPLDDWLFHYFIKLARKYDLSIQLHTGHMAGNYNDIRKTNAALLIPLMELYSDVKFDLFHANWPYMDEYLFIGKNFPNAYMDLCWAHIIDPIYCVELMKRSLVAVPHSKLMAYGGDCFSIEMSIGYLLAARDNVAYALSDMIDNGWLTVHEAKQVAADWFYNNPNEFFNLGFDRFTV